MTEKDKAMDFVIVERDVYDNMLKIITEHNATKLKHKQNAINNLNNISKEERTARAKHAVAVREAKRKQNDKSANR